MSQITTTDQKRRPPLSPLKPREDSERRLKLDPTSHTSVENTTNGTRMPFAPLNGPPQKRQKLNNESPKPMQEKQKENTSPTMVVVKATNEFDVWLEEFATPPKVPTPPRSPIAEQPPEEAAATEIPHADTALAATAQASPTRSSKKAMVVQDLPPSPAQ